jgi:hypothetical protein
LSLVSAALLQSGLGRDWPYKSPLLRSEQLRRMKLIVDEKPAYRVRLNGADHQWGKDPPKEVVG